MAIDVRSGSAVFACDDDLRVTAWNDGAERLTGFARANVLGRHCWEILRATDPQRKLVCGALCSRARRAAHGWPVEAHEVEVATEDGRARVVVDTITAEDATSRSVVHVLREAPGAAEARPSADAPRLTPRQRDVLDLLAEGKRAKEIAGRLWLSETTVRNHIRAVLRELEAHSQLEALTKARRLGLVA